MDVTMVANYLVISVIGIGVIALVVLGVIIVEDYLEMHSDVSHYLILSLERKRPVVKGVTPADYYLLRKEIDGNGNKINSYFDSMF
ncbi:hypothetical protein [Aeromonas phage AerS_266]|nr:hypothetical protein [Aeromonas phage AerS_266]